MHVGAWFAERAEIDLRPGGALEMHGDAHGTYTARLERGEASATSLAADLPVSRVAVVTHLGVLERAGPAESLRRRAED